MIVFLLLLLGAEVIVAVYATENTATMNVTLWAWHWTAVPQWLPAVLTVSVIGVLTGLYIISSGLAHATRIALMRRRLREGIEFFSFLRERQQPAL